MRDCIFRGKGRYQNLCATLAQRKNKNKTFVRIDCRQGINVDSLYLLLMKWYLMAFPKLFLNNLELIEIKERMGTLDVPMDPNKKQKSTFFFSVVLWTILERKRCFRLITSWRPQCTRKAAHQFKQRMLWKGQRHRKVSCNSELQCSWSSY